LKSRNVLTTKEAVLSLVNWTESVESESIVVELDFRLKPDIKSRYPLTVPDADKIPAGQPTSGLIQGI